MCTILYFLKRRHVVQKIQSWSFLLVKPRQQEIDLIRTFPQCCRQFAATEIGLRLGGKLETVVRELVEGQVFGNIFGKVDQVAVGTGYGHGAVGSQRLNLIKIGLVRNDRTSIRLIRGKDDYYKCVEATGGSWEVKRRFEVVLVFDHFTNLLRFQAISARFEQSHFFHRTHLLLRIEQQALYP